MDRCTRADCGPVAGDLFGGGPDARSVVVNCAPRPLVPVQGVFVDAAEAVVTEPLPLCFSQTMSWESFQPAANSVPRSRNIRIDPKHHMLLASVAARAGQPSGHRSHARLVSP
jgi:hypothetical protein